MLDLEKFRKVLALVDGGADGERDAAKARAEAMAGAAGLSFDDARLRAMASVTSAGSESQAAGWSDFFGNMMRERWRQEAPQREEALRKYGSEAAIFAETERERLLRDATAGMEWDVSEEEAPQEVRAAAMNAYPMPGNLADAFKEWREWWDLWRLRRLFRSNYETSPGISARQDRLEWMLNSWSDPTFDGLMARISWLSFCEKEDHRLGTRETLLALLSDVFMLKGDVVPRGADGKNCHPDPGDYPARRTSAEKRAAVLDMLAAHPDLSDGEIARRSGVSRQNVSNHRKAKAK
ncbi:helix-turn-helix domain-containing protein [Xanthobacter flavus]|uniref:MarR family transcriptional regulator n=1 Tax=Xanthobacter flavus TaxID=281 RepID=UPI00372B180B